MKNVVLYHGNCFDGMASAWAAWKKFGDDAEYIPVNYGNELPELRQYARSPKDIDLYIVDFSYPRDILVGLKDIFNKLVVLDHHKTAKANCEGLDFCIFDMEKSGARLTWEYFHPMIWDNHTPQGTPKLIQYVEDRDLWRFALPDSEAINAYIQSFPMTLDAYQFLWSTLELNFEQCKYQGQAIERYKQTMVETQARAAVMRVIGGCHVPVVNSSILFSEVGNYLCQHNTAPFAAYYVDRADGLRQWGLRSIGDFDVSEIAKKYNGGGHKNAAGVVTAQSYCGDIV